MQSGAPTFGTPEPSLLLYMMAQLARRLGVPFRSGGNLCASKLPDAQAAYECATTFQATLLAGTNFVLHAAGWLEGGLAVGYEKFILDEDQCGMASTFVKGVDLSENGQAMDALLTNGPGNHFLGHRPHAAQLRDRVLPLHDRQQRQLRAVADEGGLDAAQRATAAWKKRLAEYEAPAHGPGIDEALAGLHRPAQGVLPRLGHLGSRPADAWWLPVNPAAPQVWGNGGAPRWAASPECRSVGPASRAAARFAP